MDQVHYKSQFSDFPCPLHAPRSSPSLSLPLSIAKRQFTEDPTMTVEAHHHLHPVTSQLLSGNREFINAKDSQQLLPSLTYDMQMDCVDPVSAASGSGLTVAPAASRKRTRLSSFLGDDMSFQLQQQMLDVDHIIQLHAEKARIELAERRRRFMQCIFAVLEEQASKRLKAREDELAWIGKLNWALEERIKSLSMENMMWRDLAQSNEAAANVLQSSLEQVLLTAQARAEAAMAPAPADADDAESCCCGDNAGEDKDEEATIGEQGRRACRGCAEREPTVLLLPCRHLCLCAGCGPAIATCPVCNCAKNGSVHVNMF